MCVRMLEVGGQCACMLKGTFLPVSFSSLAFAPFLYSVTRASISSVAIPLTSSCRRTGWKGRVARKIKELTPVQTQHGAGHS